MHRVAQQNGILGDQWIYSLRRHSNLVQVVANSVCQAR